MLLFQNCLIHTLSTSHQWLSEVKIKSKYKYFIVQNNNIIPKDFTPLNRSPRRIQNSRHVRWIGVYITLPLSEAFYRIEKSFRVAKWECVEVTRVSKIYRDFLYKWKSCFFVWKVLWTLGILGFRDDMIMFISTSVVG